MGDATELPRPLAIEEFDVYDMKEEGNSFGKGGKNKKLYDY